MYSVSQAYINKLKSADKKIRRIRGSINSVDFTENDILDNSFSFSEIAVKSAEIKLGGVFIGSLKLTFLKSFMDRSGIARGAWKGKVINASIGLFLGYDENEQEIWEDVPIKPYKISEANHSALGIVIEAYDAMYDFDKPIEMNITTGSIYGITTLACNACGVSLGMTEEEMAELPNGDQPSLGLYPDNDIEKWRDLISWVAVTVGGFATINRDGELVFRIWKDEEDIEIGINDRFEGSTWSDFSTKYTGIKMQDMVNGTELYYAVSPDDGLTMDIGANPLLQYGIDSVREEQIRNILTAIQKLQYVPFTSKSLIDPALDLGDVILYSDGIADDAYCCVMRMDFSFTKGATLKGYGKNPALNGARSAQDKAIAQNAKNSKEQGITYYPFIGAKEISLTTTPQRLYRIAFSTAESTTVEVWHEMKWNVSGSDVEITYEYYLDGVKFDHEPVDTLDGGYHSMPHLWWLLDVEGGQVHYWEVKASLNTGSATLGIGDIHAMLKGQKLVGSVKFDGLIEISDIFEPFIGGMDIIGIQESITISTQHPSVISITDEFIPFTGGMDIIGIEDSMSITREKEQYFIITEDGDNLGTEDGDIFIT